MLIDTHAHLYLNQFSEDIELTLERAKGVGVQRIYLPNIDVSSISDLKSLAAAHPDFCFPMMGLHPCSIDEKYIEELSKIKKELFSDSYKAVGEIGIDLYWDQSFKEEQIKAFEIQISWALELDIPIVIHSRDSLDLTIASVDKMQNGNLRGIFHCFNGTVEQMQKIKSLNFLIGLGGVITYKNANLEPMIQEAPLDMIVLETDAPYLSPVPYRGKRNESAYVKEVAHKVAQIKGVTLELVEQTTSKNALALFEQHTPKEATTESDN